MILIGIGSNLAAPGYTSPREVVDAVVAELPGLGIAVARQSGWYLSEPVPPSDQPWYVNGVAVAQTNFGPSALLDELLALEARFGRRRSAPNAARSVDLDLLDYNGQRCDTEHLTLPHPRLHERRFVLIPLAEIAPEWRHARLDLTAAELLARLPSNQAVRRLGAAPIPRG